MPLKTIHRISLWGSAHPFLYYTLPIILWIGFVAWGSLAPPSELPQIDIPNFDKVEHAICYGTLAILLLRGWVRNERVSVGAFVLIELMASAWGLYMEFMQKLTPYRTFDLWDAAANATGALIGLTAWTLWIGRFGPKRNLETGL